ncbi:MAG: hypothetical protein ACKOBN_09275 [Flavobacteriales bacterium]
MNIDQRNNLDDELEAWSEIKYQAKHITFEPKSALYKKRPIALQIAVYAALLLFVSSSIFLLNDTKNNTVEKSHLSSNKKTVEKRFSVSNKKQVSTHRLAKLAFGEANNNTLSFLTNEIPGSTSVEIDFSNNHDFALNENVVSDRIDFSNSNILSRDFSKSENASTIANKESLIPTLSPKTIQYFWPSLTVATANNAANNAKSLDLNMNLLAKIDRFVGKEIGLSNNQSYDLLLPGKSNIDAQISSVGSISQTRFQSTSNLRSHTNTEQMLLQQQLSLDAYSRALRSGFGLQTNYKQYANGAVSDYEIACIAAPKLLLTRNIILEPSMRLKLGSRYADANKLQQLSFIELAATDIRQVQIDSTMDIGRKIFYKDLDFGLGIQTPIFFINAQLENTFKHFDYAFGNQLQNSTQRALQNWTISLGTQYASRNEKMRLSPYVIFTKMGSVQNYYSGFQFNYKYFQFGASYGSGQQYQLATGLIGKHCALLIQSARQQLLSLNTPSYSHQVSLRFYSQPSRKARRYISL